MNNELESILSINRCLAKFRDDSKRTKLLRRYLRTKVDSALKSKFQPRLITASFLNIPLSLLSL